jgi:hypothetical protein
MALVFYDWKFYENKKAIEPISLGIIDDTGRELYLVNNDFDWDSCLNKSLQDFIKPQVAIGLSEAKEAYKCTADEIGDRILDWLRPYIKDGEAIYLASYCTAFNHVLLVQQLGGLSNCPKFIPDWTRDLKQNFADLGIEEEELIGKKDNANNALFTARWIRNIYYDTYVKEIINLAS